MKKILFVCLGNICRSPMAEYVFKYLAEKNGVSSDFYVESKATSREEEGNPIYPPAQAVLRKNGIPFEKRGATKITLSDYQNFDYIICMDSNNFARLNSIFDDKQGKICKLLSFLGDSGDILDPWYSGDFDTCFEQIYNSCDALLKTLI